MIVTAPLVPPPVRFVPAVTEVMSPELLVYPALLLNVDIFILPGAILYCEPLLFTTAKKSALPALVVVDKPFKFNDNVPVVVIVPPVNPVPVATEVTP